MRTFLGVTLITLSFTGVSLAENKRILSSTSSKVAFNFPETQVGQIAIQTGLGRFEVLPFTEEAGHALAQSCETELKNTCRAQQLREILNKSSKELAEKCNDLEGEKRIARRHGVQKITSVCYFKEDKSFIEF